MKLIARSAFVSLISFAAAVDPWTYRPGTGFGAVPVEDSNTTSSSGSDLILSTLNNPNSTTSVPFTLSGQNFTLSVDIIDFAPTGATNGSVSNPRAVDTSYRLSWLGGKSLNDTVSDAEDASQPRLCAHLALGGWPARVNDAYEAQDGGSCNNALGEECTTALTNMGYSAGVGCGGFQIPDACADIWPSGGVGSASLLSNETINSPYRFAYYASPIRANVSDFYDQQTNSVHVIVFSGTQSRPVCVRPFASADQNQGSDASGRMAVPVVMGVGAGVMAMMAVLW